MIEIQRIKSHSETDSPRDVIPDTRHSVDTKEVELVEAAIQEMELLQELSYLFTEITKSMPPST